MSFINTAYRKYIVPIGIIDLITAIVYGLVILGLFIALDMWWLFPTLLGVLVVAYAVRALVRALVHARKTSAVRD
jgi:hypothetical protein